jgi:NADH dehydrogenase
MRKRIMITGAFGNSGGFIAERLLKSGQRVETLTASPERPSPLQGRVPAWPFNFGDPAALTRCLKGVDVLINNFWVRYEAGGFRHADAVRKNALLFGAAKRARVKRIVHVSITHADAGSPYAYFSGKGEVEASLRRTGLPYSILRPGVLFGDDEILVNNVAWVLRRAPCFGLFGDGKFSLRPIHVEDLADLAARESEAAGKRILNAVGPERPSYRSWVQSIAGAIGSATPILAMPPRLAWAGGCALGWLRRDAIIVWEEIAALMEGLIDAEGPATGRTRFSDWVRRAGPSLGLHYRNELSRRRDRQLRYGFAA